MVVKPKLKELSVWVDYIDVISYIDQPLPPKESVSSVNGIERVDLQRRIYIWYNIFDENTTIYGVIRNLLYRPYRTICDNTRLVLSTIIPFPYSISYNDSVLSILIEVKPFDYNSYISFDEYSSYNKLLECISLLDGYVLMHSYFIMSVLDDYWFLLIVDDNTIIIVCIFYSDDILLRINIYVVSTIEINSCVGNIVLYKTQ